MKIALASDLHLEFETITLPNTEGAKVLILSGDIVTAYALHEHPVVTPPNDPNVIWKPGKQQLQALRFREFFHHVNQEYDHVIYIAGNHEFYHGKFPDAYDWLHEEIKKYDNIHFLDKEHIEIDDVVFVGGTLWTDMNRNDPTTMQLIESMMNDFRIIRNSQRNYARFSPLDSVIHHRATLEHIKKVVDSDATKKYVVVGHHAPSKQSVKPRYERDIHMNGAYSSDLSEFIMDHPQIKLWTHGHTHDKFDYMVGTTRIVCNPRGYVGYEVDTELAELVFIDV